MQAEPLVSIVIPLYGRPQFLEELMGSVLSQRYPHIEIILVDDNGAGTEMQLETRDLVNEFCMGNVCYVVNESNVGVSATRNNGVKFSKGAYVTFLDDDDVYYINKVSFQLEEMVQRGLDISVCSFDRFDSDGFLVNRSAIQPKLESIQDFFFGESSIHAPTIMIKRDFFLAIGGFNESLAYREDRMLIARAMSYGAIIGSIQKPLFKYRVHSGYRLSKKRFSREEVNSIDEIAIEEEKKLRDMLAPEDRKELDFIRAYKKINAYYKNGCDIPFGLATHVVSYSVRNGKAKSAVRSVLRYMKSKLKS
ncbi:glycosyltransferase family 2 protein [Billgrantia diversa]|uniref:glycosyltransferase family 2 protein n=1 Tax=Halomonas sp. MCCC 1A13316 TaxID=2733487 RepID=UPI0018A36578|nr:glycosyltransferase family 2 protein [Halomonas sp. MCCC 1A13316]QOR39029.1 glycosyltransferase family 2 protein [Halomonas sp. MCCC 1A13316]